MTSATPLAVPAVHAPDLASLLASGERAAFHGPPGAAVAALEQAAVLAEGLGRSAEVTAAAWLLGVALGASGRYGGALTVLTPLVERGEHGDGGPEGRLFAAFAAATVASLHRQLGRHEEAWGWDERGLAVAGDVDEARFDCLLGLTADAVGVADAVTADARLLDAEALAEGRDGEWWRQQVRLDWVRAEVALLTGRAGAAVEHAQHAVEAAERARAPRHVAKGLLFLGVAQHEAGEPEAVGTLRRAATLAESLGTLPLVWPARAVLGALLLGQADGQDAGAEPAEAGRCLAAARAAVLRIAEDLPGPLRTDWLARPDVAGLIT